MVKIIITYSSSDCQILQLGLPLMRFFQGCGMPLTDEMNDYASRVSQIVRTDENGQDA